MFRKTFAVLTFVLLPAVPASHAAAPSSPVESVAADATPVPADAAAPAGHPAFGPILSRDPLVRAEIKKLYLERNRIRDEATARVTEIAGRIAEETDPDFRFALYAELRGVRDDEQLRTMELGLEIARLDGDDARVAEYELALDQLSHPEKYRPAPVDPSVQRERIRAMEAANGGAR